LNINQAFTQYVEASEGAAAEDEDGGAQADMAKALYKMATVPEYQCRFEWRAGSVAFWDNRACQHVSAECCVLCAV
jgi:taurine dioxygenase